MPTRGQPSSAGAADDSDSADGRDNDDRRMANREQAAMIATIRDVNSRADRQLDMLLKSMPALKEVGWHDWDKAYALQAYGCKWAPQIWDLNVAALTSAQIIEEDAIETPEGVKNSLDRRNAFLTIMYHTRGDTVENLLESSTPGDPRKAYDIMSSFFNPTTTAGTQQAIRTFYSASMGQSKTNIVSWVAYVSRAARVVRNSGGQANDLSELSILMGGLLPEFNHIKTILDNKPGLTLAVAISSLMDYARAQNLLELCKGGTAKGGNSVFYANNVSDIPISEQTCYNWSKYCCGREPGTCPRKHVGPGG